MKKLFYYTGLFFCNAFVSGGAGLIAYNAGGWVGGAALGVALVVFGITGWIVVNTDPYRP